MAPHPTSEVSGDPRGGILEDMKRVLEVHDMVKYVNNIDYTKFGAKKNFKTRPDSHAHHSEMYSKYKGITHLAASKILNRALKAKYLEYLGNDKVAYILTITPEKGSHLIDTTFNMPTGLWDVISESYGFRIFSVLIAFGAALIGIVIGKVF